MPATVIVGLQWGDEGKGKTTDFLAEQVAMAVRYQGGDNAGHTVVLGDEVFKLRLTPSGVLYPHIASRHRARASWSTRTTLIGELDMLASRGIDTAKVRVSRNAHVIMPYHVALDRAMEVRLGGEKVGTTNRGIGPTYADRASRLGLRMEDLLDEATFRHRLERVLPDKNTLLATMAGTERFEIEPLVAPAMAWGERLRPHLADTTWLVQDALAPGRPRPPRGRPGDAPRPRPRQLPVRHLVEPDRRRRLHGRRDRAAPGRRGHRGDEGVHDPGRLRAVSDRARGRRSGPGSPSAATSSGRSPADRAGSAGSTPSPLRYAVAVNSVSSIMLNKLDILSGIEEILLCVAYEIDGAAGRELAVERRGRSPGPRPIYERFPGWAEPHPRRPDAGRAARERPALRGRARGAGRRPDRPRLGRPRADPDDRAGLPTDAPPDRP